MPKNRNFVWEKRASRGAGRYAMKYGIVGMIANVLPRLRIGREDFFIYTWGPNALNYPTVAVN